MPVPIAQYLPPASTPRARRLALWLMLGCVPAAGLAPSTELCGAAEMEHPAIKVPTFRPTDSVQSVLGMRLSQSEWLSPLEQHVGASIQLLPPTPRAHPAVTAPATPPTPGTLSLTLPQSDPSDTTPLRVTSAPSLVTRDNAELKGFQRTWQASTASDRHHYPAWLAPNDIPPNDTASNGAVTSDKPINATSSPSAQTDTGGWEPRGQSQSHTSPTQQSRTAEVPGRQATDHESAENTSAGNLTPPHQNPVGSGIESTPKPTQPPPLSPVQRMPSLEKVLPAVEDSLAPNAPPDDAGEVSLESPKLTPKSNINDTDVNEGNNEGNNEGGTSGPAENDDWEGNEPEHLREDSIMHRLLEKPIDVDTPANAMQTPTAPNRSRPELSTTQIKQLIVNPDDRVRPLEDKADLRDVRQDTASQSRNHSAVEDIAVQSLGRLLQLDATGRVKTHSGPGAVDNLSPAIAGLQRPILQTLRSFHARTEQADARSNWGMMHSIMVYGADTRIIARRRNYSAIAWIAGNNACRGNRLMTTEQGKIKVREGAGLQGHQAQFLAVLSLAGVPSNYPLYADTRQFTVEDLVQVEAAACEDRKELTFTLIGLAHYLETDATWTGVRGQRWDFNRLIAAELSEPVVGAACGGTHRLMGFAHALRKRRLEERPTDGQWKRAEDFLNDFVPYTYSLQNRDGSFSTNWYESRQDNGDLQRKVQTTGHMLEFLLTHLPDEDLVDPHVVAAVRFLLGAMGRVQLDDAGVGYRGHALRSLAMYYRRVYGVAPDYAQGSVATGQHHRQNRR